MKRILLLIIFFSLNVYSFAQRTNSRGEYLVKSVHWVNALTQKEIGNKGDKWYYFKYDNDGKLIEVRKEFYENFKYKTTETFTIANSRYQFISYMNGKQVLNSKSQFTFNKQGYMDKLYIYETNGERWSTVGTLTYNDNGELKSIELTSEQKGGNHYKIRNYEEYKWENGNMITCYDPEESNKGYGLCGERLTYGNVMNDTNINLSSLIKHGSSPCNEHILFITEWGGKKSKNLIKDKDFTYIYKDDLLYEIVKNGGGIFFGYHLIEYVY